MSAAELPSQPLTAHSLQLLVHQGPSSQRSVADVTNSHLEDIQLEQKLLEKVVSVFGPFEDLTQKVSSSDAMATDVTPAVTVAQISNKTLMRTNEGNLGCSNQEAIH